MQSSVFFRPTGRDWLSQTFQCRAAQSGGIVRRQIIDVEREVGVAALVEEVAKRGFRLILAEHHFVIVCSNGPIQVIR